MSHFEPTFIFENGKVYACIGRKVVAAAASFDELEKQLKQAAPEGPEGSDIEFAMPGPEGSTHVITPNGLKGRILGKAKDVWGDTVTVRLENGRIAQFHISEDCQFLSEEQERIKPILALQQRLATTHPGDVQSLSDRKAELVALRAEAKDLVAKGLSDKDLAEVDSLIMTASGELRDIEARLEYLADAESMAPSSPSYEVFEQESVGAGDASWLDHTLNEMIAEAEATDYDRLMDEGPETFTASLDTVALADAGVTRTMASSFIRTKTAGAREEVREEYEKVWLARIEQARRQELASRKRRTKKEAAALPEVEHISDEALFG